MGKNKALLPAHGGGTTLDYSISIARDCLSELGQDPQQVIVSGRYPGMECVPDEFQEAGPLGGIHSCLRYFCREERSDNTLEYVLFVPVDMPALSVNELKSLIMGVEPGDEIVKFEDSELPLVVAVNQEMIGAIEQQLTTHSENRPDLSIRTLISRCRKVRELKLGANAALINVNTPAEYNSWFSQR